MSKHWKWGVNLTVIKKDTLQYVTDVWMQTLWSTKTEIIALIVDIHSSGIVLDLILYLLLNSFLIQTFLSMKSLLSSEKNQSKHHKLLKRRNHQTNSKSLTTMVGKKTFMGSNRHFHLLKSKMMMRLRMIPSLKRWWNGLKPK